MENIAQLTCVHFASALEKVTPYLLKADLVEKAKAKVLEKATPYLEKAKVLKKADDLEKAKVQPKKKVVPYLAGTRRSAGSGTSDAGRNSSRAHSTTHPFSFGAADAGGGAFQTQYPLLSPNNQRTMPPHHTRRQTLLGAFQPQYPPLSLPLPI